MDIYEVVNCFFKYYKGGLYKVIGEVIYIEIEEKFVIYEDMNGILWVRLKDMFFGIVVVDGKEVNRFIKIN